MINRYDKTDRYSAETTEDVSSLKTKYEEIIFDLTEKLNDVKAELDIAHEERTSLKEKFKRFETRHVMLYSMRSGFKW